METNCVSASSSSTAPKFKQTRLVDSLLRIICSFLTTSEHVLAFARCCKHWAFAAANPASWRGVVFSPRGHVGNGRLPGIIERWNLQRCRGVRCTFQHMIGQDFAALKSMSCTLEILELERDIFGHIYSDGTCAAWLKSAIECLPNLKRLAVPPMRFIEIDIAPPSWLACLPQELQSLSLAHCTGTFTIGMLSRFCPNITEFDISKTNGNLITAIALPDGNFFVESITFSEFGDMPKLTRLNASESRFFNGWNQTDHLGSLRHITDIDLSGNALSVSSLFWVGRNWPTRLSPNLRRLILKNNQIQALDFALKLPNLEELDVTDNKLDLGALTCGIWKHKKLQKLTITRCHVQFWEVVQFQWLRLDGDGDTDAPGPGLLLVNERDDLQLESGDELPVNFRPSDKAVHFSDVDVKAAVDRLMTGQRSSDHSEESELDDWEDEPEDKHEDTESAEEEDADEEEEEDSDGKKAAKRKRKNRKRKRTQVLYNRSRKVRSKTRPRQCIHKYKCSSPCKCWKCVD